MNRTVALIDELSKLGVTLSRTGDQIVIDGPEAVLTDALVERLRSFKSEILRSLEDWVLLTGRRILMSELGSLNSTAKSRASRLSDLLLRLVSWNG